MRKILFAILLLLSFSSFGQSLKNLKVYCTDEFNPKASITVQRANPDYIGITDVLKNNLVMNGFKVISEAVAKERVELSNKKQTSDTTVNQDISLGKTTYIKSVYVITFSYDYFENASGTYLQGLNGQVVDLANDGEIVATFSYHHGPAFAKKPSKVIEALCESLKGKQSKKR
jgi:hypothetical protein